MMSFLTAQVPGTDSMVQTILLVDVDQTSRNSFAQALETRGFRWVEAETGEDAIRVATLGDPRIDMVVIGEVEGTPGVLRTIETLRRLVGFEDLPVIRALPPDSKTEAGLSLQAGATNYVNYPLGRSELERIEFHLRTKTSVLATRVEIGTVLDNRYRIEREIGQGGFGIVYQALHIDLDARVALKVLHPERFLEAKTRKRLQSEGRALAKLRHPNIVSVLDLVSRGEIWYLVMELLRGRNLGDVLRERAYLSPVDACRILVPAADALAAAHRSHILHRDVKPTNLFLHQNADGQVVKVLDFGLAEHASAPEFERHRSRPRGLTGSPRYMAPERLFDHVDRTEGDVFSLGAVAFEMLTAESVFGPKVRSLIDVLKAHAQGGLRRVRDVAPHVSRELDTLVAAALAPNPEDRPSAAEIAEGAQRELRHEPRPAQRTVDIAMADAATEPLRVEHLRDFMDASS